MTQDELWRQAASAAGLDTALQAFPEDVKAAVQSAAGLSRQMLPPADPLANPLADPRAEPWPPMRMAAQP